MFSSIEELSISFNPPRRVGRVTHSKMNFNNFLKDIVFSYSEQLENALLLIILNYSIFKMKYSMGYEIYAYDLY